MEILISLVMIVRNEEVRLPKCLDSLSLEVDEIIIVDTGSTDQTLKVAQNYTDKVYSYSWSNDFSAARNFALQKATGQWVLSLDADEYLETKEGELRALVLANPAIEAYLLPLYNPTSENLEEYNLFHVLRLFRNNGHYLFSGRIHEQVIVPTEQVVDIASSPIIRHHFLPPKERRRKRERNLRLLKQCLQSAPHNPYLWYYTGVEWIMLNKPAKALPYLQASYELLPVDRPMFKTSALRYCVIALQSFGEVPKALELIVEGNSLYPQYADLLYLGGVLFREIQEYSQAVKWFKAALAAGSPPPFYSHHTGAESYLSYYQLGYCYEQLGKIDQAQEVYLIALNTHSSYLYPLYPLMHIAINLNGPRQALALLSQQDLLAQPTLAFAAAEVFYMIGYPHLALECLNNLAPPMADGRFLLGKALLFSGRSSEALQVLDSLYQEGSFLSDLSEKSLNKPSNIPSKVSRPPTGFKTRLYLLVAFLLSGSYTQARSLALELWQNVPTRHMGFALLALIKLMEKNILSPLPRRIQNSEPSTFLESLYQDFLNCYLPLTQEPNSQYVLMMNSLQTLIRTASSEEGKNLANLHRQKYQEARNRFQQKFGTGWLIP